MDFTHTRMLERVVDRINALNNTQIDYTEVEIKAVGTKYQVAPLPGSRYYKMDLVQYQEIDLAGLFRGVPLHMVRADGMTYQDVINWVNETFTLDMGAEDFAQDLSQPVPSTGDELIINLDVLEECPFFFGTLTLTIRPDSIAIGSLWQYTMFALPLVDNPTQIKSQTTYLSLPVTLGKVGSAITGLYVGDSLDPRAVALLFNASGGANLDDIFAILNIAKVAYNGPIADFNMAVNLPPFLSTSTHILVLEYLRPPANAYTSYVSFRYEL